MVAFLRWAGSKRQIIPKLEQFWSDSFHRYHEPFLGSGSLLFAVRPTCALGSDVNGPLIEMYKMVCSDPRKVYETALSFEVSKENYYRLREMDVSSLGEIQRAARFIYLNRYCFNGIYRTNKLGKFNVPFSGARTGGFPDIEVFMSAADQLKKTTLRCLDFEEAIKNYVKEGDFVYLDPPYFKKGHRIFAEYSPTSFTEVDLDRLLDCIDFIDRNGATFVLSYAYSDEIKLLLKKHRHYEVLIRRIVASNSSSRSRKKELLISNAIASPISWSRGKIA